MSSPASAPVGSVSTSPPPSASTSPPQPTSPPSSSAAPPTNTSSSAPPPAEQTPAAAPPLPSEPPVSPPSPPAPPPQSPSPPSPPPPSQTSVPPPAEPPPSPPPPSADSPPPPAQSSSPPAASPPESNASPPPPASTLRSPPPPASTLRSPPPPASSITSPPPPGTSTLLSPPPPPSLTSSPTTTPTTPSTPTPSSPSPSSSSTISSGAVAGIAVVAVVAVSVFLVVCLCFCNKNKKKRRYYYTGEHQGPPGGDPAHRKDSYYDHNTTQDGWQSPLSTKSTDVFLNMPSPPPPMPFIMSKHDKAFSNGNSGAPPGIGNSNLWLTYNELAAATNGFSKSNLLGEGGFGCVYKGILTNGKVVAVKQLKSGASQGEKEFQAEVDIISRVHHRHLVSLVGYCIMENQRLLVYDYVPNNTLEYHLHKQRGGPSLDWPTRLRVASGAARGLAYLHEDCHPRIIHRDIKSANILLDNNFEAQVSDFGLAKLTSDAYTHVTTRVMGTFGYLAPEYASSGKLTEKSDVFSFGVVLLELLTGRKPVDILQPPGEESLVEWARPILAQVDSEEDLNMLADPSLNGVYDRKEMMRMMEAAAACVRHSAPRRPKMGQVMRALEDETSLADLNKGLRPGHSSVYGSSFTSSDYERGSYSADMRKFRMALNESREGGMLTNPYSSSEYRTSREIDQDIRRPTNSTFSSSGEFL